MDPYGTQDRYVRELKELYEKEKEASEKNKSCAEQEQKLKLDFANDQIESTKQLYTSFEPFKFDQSRVGLPKLHELLEEGMSKYNYIFINIYVFY